MRGLSGWSETTFSDAEPPAPDSSSSFFESIARQGGPAKMDWANFDATVRRQNETADAAKSSFARIFDAADRQTRFVESTNAREVADSQVYETIINQVRDATGVTLENPNYMPFSRDTDSRRRMRAAFDETRSADQIMADHRTAFFDKARELKAANPDKLGGLDLETPTGAQARGLAANADRELKSAMAADENTIPAYAASLAGGIWGSRQDPLMWASLPFGAAGKGVSVVARLFSAAVRNATANAAFSTLAQPAVQLWRKEAGLESGLGEAAKNIGFAFATGAVLGGGIKGISEAALAPAIGRIKAGNGTEADFAAAAHSGVFFDDETRDALKAAGRLERADAEILRDVPDGVNPESARMTLAEATARVEDPDAPLPLVDRPLPAGTSDDAAREILDTAPDFLTALDRLRSDGDATLSALASDIPAIRDMGRLATLPEEALDLVRQGEIPADQAAVVAATTHDALEQAGLMALLKDARPRDVAAARAVISDKLEADVAVHAGVARMGQSEAALDKPADPPRFPEGDMRANVPIERDDGTVGFVSRESLGLVSDRERRLAFVAETCTM